jgi:hypothetical protein
MWSTQTYKNIAGTALGRRLQSACSSWPPQSGYARQKLIVTEMLLDL